MDRTVGVIATAAAGGLIALQAPMNSTLARSVGATQAAFATFAIGTLVLAVLAALAQGGLAQLDGARSVGWIYLLGGILGAVYVFTALLTVRTLGVGGVTAATIAGQLTLALIVDHFGWLGVTRHPLTLAEAVGVILLAFGSYLIVRE